MRLFKSKKAEEIKSLKDNLNSLRQQLAASLRPVQTINDSIARFPDYSITDTTNKYITSDHIYSVVNKIAETSSLIPFYSYIEKKDEAVKKLNTVTARQYYTTKGLFDIKRLQIKALEDAPENDELNNLLEEPNPYQSKGEFFLAAYVYYLLNGECIIWKERLAMGANGGKVKRLHIWAPDQVVIHVTREYPQTIVRYDYVVEGKTITFAPPEDIIHWKRLNPGRICFNQDDFRGLSPLKALTNTITRMFESDTRSVSMIKNGGTPGIVYDESIGADEIGQTEFDLQKKAFYDHVTNSDNAGAPFFVGSKKGYVSTGLKMADLELLALGKVDFKRLCNAYKISDILFNSDAASTESNVREMIKQMYTNACLPMIYSFRDKLNRELANEFQRFLDIDISEITELQDDMKEMADILAALPIPPTGNEMRELFNYERIDDNPLMDEVLVKQGYILLNEISTQDISLNDLQP